MTQQCLAFTMAETALLNYHAYGIYKSTEHRFESIDHGSLPPSADEALSIGLLRFGLPDIDRFGVISDLVFQAYSKCLHPALQTKKYTNCNICANIRDFIKHSSSCKSHPEICSACRCTIHLLTFHLSDGLNCSEPFCLKIKEKTRKRTRSSTELHLIWAKIQQYCGQAFPRPLTKEDMNLAKQSLDPTPAKVELAQHQKTEALKPPSLFAKTPDHGNMTVKEWRGRGDDSTMIHSRAPSPEIPTSGAEAPPQPFPYVHACPLPQQIVPGLGDSNLQFPEPQAQYLPMPTFRMEPGGFYDSSPDVPRPTGPPSSSGHGRVINGEPRHLIEMAKYWTKLKIWQKCNADPSILQSATPSEYDGVLIEGKPIDLRSENGMYLKKKHWEKISLLGEGAFGIVYLATDTRTGDVFAVKKIKLENYEEDELILWSELEHPNLVQLYGALRVNNKIYVLSQLFNAGSLSQMVTDTHGSPRRLDQFISLYFMQQLLEALTYLVTKQTLHEDLKADNVFLEAGSFKLAIGDFGLSRKAPAPPSNESRPRGAAVSWSPEKADGRKLYGHSSDLWAAVCTMIHMLTGKAPWTERFQHASYGIQNIIATRSPPVEDIPANLIEQVDHMIRVGLTMNPAERPSAEDLLTHNAFRLLEMDRNHPAFFSHLQPGSAELVPPSATHSDRINEMCADLEGYSEEEARGYLAGVMEDPSLGDHEEADHSNLDVVHGFSEEQKLLEVRHELDALGLGDDLNMNDSLDPIDETVYGPGGFIPNSPQPVDLEPSSLQYDSNSSGFSIDLDALDSMSESTSLKRLSMTLPSISEEPEAPVTTSRRPQRKADRPTPLKIPSEPRTTDRWSLQRSQTMQYEATGGPKLSKRSLTSPGSGSGKAGMPSFFSEAAATPAEDDTAPDLLGEVDIFSLPSSHSIPDPVSHPARRPLSSGYFTATPGTGGQIPECVFGSQYDMQQVEEEGHNVAQAQFNRLHDDDDLDHDGDDDAMDFE